MQVNVIWLLMFLPAVSAAYLYSRYAKKMVWWEYVCQFVFAALLIFIVKISVEAGQVSDTEYWGSLVESVYEKEPYNDWIYRTCSCCCNEKGSNCLTYDCSYQSNYSASWWMITTLGEEYSISENLYNQINEKFGESRTQISSIKNHSSDSNANAKKGSKFKNKKVGKYSYTYKTKWSGTYETHHFIASSHRYENRVQVSNSIMNYAEVTKEDAMKNSLYEYPEVDSDHDLPSILYPQGFSLNLEEADKKLKWLNGKLGPRNNHRQIRVWLLIYQNKSRSVAELQEAYWKNGNKNELVICVGLNSENKADWVHTFTWSEVQTIPIDIREIILNQERFDAITFSDSLYSIIENDWRRKQFSDFSYLDVEPPIWSIILAFILQVALQIIWGRFSILNEFDYN